jgi:hypothetical protein
MLFVSTQTPLCFVFWFLMFFLVVAVVEVRLRASLSALGYRKRTPVANNVAPTPLDQAVPAVTSAKPLITSPLLIGLMIISFDSELHRHPQWQFAPTASPQLDFQRSVVGPPAPPKLVFCMCIRLAESAVLISSTVLSND